jgi:dynein heavy chain 2
VEDHLERCKASFDPKTIMHASVAAAPLAAWVKANIAYSSVLESVAPLEKELDKANKSLEKSRARVQKLQRALERVDNKVATLRDDFAKRTTEMVSLQAELDKATEILTAAESLIGKLGSERDRWASQVEEVSSALRTYNLFRFTFKPI